MKVPEWVIKLNDGDVFLAYFPFSGKYIECTIIASYIHGINCHYSDDDPFNDFMLEYSNYDTVPEPDHWTAYEMKQNESNNRRQS